MARREESEMKVTTQPPPNSLPLKVFVELSTKEAQDLYDVVGHITGSESTSPRGTASDLYNKLEVLGFEGHRPPRTDMAF